MNSGSVYITIGWALQIQWHMCTHWNHIGVIHVCKFIIYPSWHWGCLWSIIKKGSSSYFKTFKAYAIAIGFTYIWDKSSFNVLSKYLNSQFYIQIKYKQINSWLSLSVDKCCILLSWVSYCGLYYVLLMQKHLWYKKCGQVK